VGSNRVLASRLDLVSFITCAWSISTSCIWFGSRLVLRLRDSTVLR
jgi:hypothetical protein